jgi:uncharacterized membrane protein YfcA
VDDFGLETLAFLFGALMLGGTVKGIVGIAYPMVAVSMMSSVIEVPTAVVLVILPSVASNLLQSGVIRGSWGRPPHLESGGHPPVAPRGSRGIPPHLESGGYPPVAPGGSSVLFRRFWPVILPLGVGLWWSAGMVAEASPDNLFIALGIVVVGFSVTSLYTPHLRIPRRAERWAGAVAGILSGLMGGFSTILGPPITMYLVALNLEKEVFIRAVGLIFLSASFMLAVFYGAHGVLHAGNIAWSISACLPVVLGYGVGQWVRGYFDQNLFRKMLLGALIVVGLNLLRRGLM